MLDRPSPSFLFSVFLLGCTGAPHVVAAGLAAQEGQPVDGQTHPQQGPARAAEFEPIRFGDKGGHEYERTFFPGATYDDSITRPEALLGQPVGSRLARHDEILHAFGTWADESPRVTLASYGRTYEGRELVRAIITSTDNQLRIEAIKRDAQRLFDPRGLTTSAADALLAGQPAIAFMGYSIHGDETSGADAALAVGYHLTAGTSADVTGLLDDVVVVLDPCMNPDGRTRILSMVEQNAGYRVNLNDESIHRGRWPYGRGNHFLFDMNRDWMAGICPETRGRWEVNLEFPPQLFVDAHEQGGDDTFLFYPQARPHHPALPATLIAWQGRFGDDHAAAFDAYGWGYYTREWADAWYPGYSDAWGALNGAIGILYEQARYGGQPYMRPSGEVVSYREAVHHQSIASLANLATLRANREEILADYLAARRRNVDDGRDGGRRVLCYVAERPSRAKAFLETLLRQGIEVQVAGAEFVVTDAISALGSREKEHRFPAGTFVIAAAQPQAGLVEAFLAFDPRMDEETLVEERGQLERGEGTKMYDVTAWDLARQLDLDAWWATPSSAGPEGADPEGIELETIDLDGLVAALPAALSGARLGGEVLGRADTPFGWLVDGTDDRSVAFAARAMELGLKVHLSDEEFEARVVLGDGAGVDDGIVIMPRGSLLLRRHENPPGAGEVVAQVAREVGIDVFRTGTGRAPGDGPDLGGGHFVLLERPRVAILTGSPVSSEDFGHVWRSLDEELRVPAALLDVQSFGSYDLRRYNVLVVPPAFGLARALGAHADDLRTWVRAGGTLIAIGASAAALTEEPLDLSSVVLRRAALDELDGYEFLARRADDARKIELDLEALWGDSSDSENWESGAEEGLSAAGQEEGAPTEEAAAHENDEGNDDGDDGEDPDAERRDSWMRRFAPTGCILRATVDVKAWLTVGARDEIPVFYSGSNVFLSKEPAPVRLASAARVRLAGLLWPEARERLRDGAWAMVESSGQGQVVLFADSPVFRGSWRGTARFLHNAVVYGPGAGTRPPRGW